MVQDYAELACRSNFSLLDGASHPGELAVAAATLGHAGFGICDTNTLSGSVRGHVAARLLTQHGRDVRNLDGGYRTWSLGTGA